MSQIYFWNTTLHVSDSSSVHRQEFFTVHTAMVHIIQVLWQLARKLLQNLYVLLCVQWKTPDDGQRNCPKHVEFYSKNKFVKLVHVVGFIIRIYHDSRPPERQKNCSVCKANGIQNLLWNLRTCRVFSFCTTGIPFIIQNGASLSTDMLIPICSQPIAY